MLLFLRLGGVTLYAHQTINGDLILLLCVCRGTGRRSTRNNIRALRCRVIGSRNVLAFAPSGDQIQLAVFHIVHLYDHIRSTQAK